jgi:hypothetical protein
LEFPAFCITCIFLGGGYNYYMTPDEKSAKINEILEHAIAELEILKQKRKDIIKNEIDKIEAEQIQKIRDSLSVLSTNQ